MQHITVKDFGPIKYFDGDIERFTIFIGPQTSGKSTLAKLLFFFYKIPSFFGLLSFGTTKDFSLNQQFQAALRSEFFSCFPATWLHKNTFIVFEDYERNISIQIGIDSESSTLFFFLDQDTVGNIVEYNKSLREDSYIRFNDLFSLPGDIGSPSDVFFLPAERAALTVIPDKIMGLLAQSSPFFANYIKQIQRIQPHFLQGLDAAYHYLCPPEEHDVLEDRAQQNLAKKVKNILDGDYTKTESGEFIVRGKVRTRLAESSSGQQDIIWPLLLAYAGIVQKKRRLFIMEEPEAHLFPETQAQFVNILALLANAHAGNHVIITTHSPYILEACNNLLLAGTVGKHNAEKIAIIVDKELWLDVQHVQAYMLKNRKTAKSIINKKLGRIKSEAIDAISHKLNDNFDAMMEIEYGIK